jgi:hypothetical protein
MAGKHFSTAPKTCSCGKGYTHNSEGLLEAVFSMWSIMRLYNRDQWGKSVVRQSPASKDMSTEAEEHPLLGATIYQRPMKTVRVYSDL